MLREIRCDFFREPIVKFHNGLNVILGDNKASNSIGKSTMLMIIDFVYGGNSYITVNYDAIENLGHHEFKYKFEFEDESVYFVRKTDKYRYVYHCNDKYEIIGEIPLSDYTNLLKEKYRIKLPIITFRGIVSLYSRIWGKENYNVKRPLQQARVKSKDAIQDIIKLFGKYNGIKALVEQMENLTERKDAINRATKNELLPHITHSLYKQNAIKVKELRIEMDYVASDIEAIRTNIQDLVSKEVLSLRNDRSILIRRRNILEDRLKRTRANIGRRNPALKNQLAKLTDYFPEIELERLNIVDAFHENISNVLKSEFKKTENGLLETIQIINEDLIMLDNKINEKLNIKEAPKYTIERIVELASKIDQLEKTNALYEKKLKIQEDISKAKSDLADIKVNVLADINHQINIAIQELNGNINSDGRRAPFLELKEETYEFKGFDDTGTGKAYANLITFDLAVFSLTPLPFLIHDTLLFKNVENIAFEHIVDIYSQQIRQVFIAVDEINKFNHKTESTLNQCSVLKLSESQTLFVKDWKKQKN